MEQFERRSREQKVVVLTPSLTVVRVAMDLFQHRYYRLYKIMMTLAGLWPYHSIDLRRGTVAVVLFLSINQGIPLLMAIVKYRDDESVLLDSTMAVLFGAAYVTKLINFTWNSEKTLQLLNRTRKDWYEWAGDREVNILHQYAEQGRKMTIGYLVMTITSHNVFMIQPAIPKIIDVFLKNGTELGKFPYPVDYYHLDMQKYYFLLIVIMYVCVSAITVVVATSDIMLICYVQHACGIFAALGKKLERLGNNGQFVKTSEPQCALDKKNIAFIASCIDRHNDAIEYVNLVAASYSWNFFFTTGLGVILFNIVGLQILLRTNDPESIARFIGFLLMLTFYFFVDCYISETVTDHNISLYFCIYNNQWYKLSLKAQKLLQFMVIRCSAPCQLTAGNMLVMSMRNFWLTTKTAISYLMLLHSMQGFEETR